MTFVVAHVETVLDQPRHPGTGPQRCREAVGFRAFEKESLQLRELHLAQQRLAAGTPSLRQTGCAAFAVLTHPAAHALLRRFDSPRRFVLAEILFDHQPHRLDPPPLQRGKVSFHAFWETHIQKTSALSKWLLYIVRDSVDARNRRKVSF